MSRSQVPKKSLGQFFIKYASKAATIVRDSLTICTTSI
jgi:hypothetical protein